MTDQSLALCSPGSTQPRSSGRDTNGRKTSAATTTPSRRCLTYGCLRRKKAPRHSCYSGSTEDGFRIPFGLSLADWCHAQHSVYNWADDIAENQAIARSLTARPQK